MLLRLVTRHIPSRYRQQHYLGSSETTPQGTPQASPLKNIPYGGNRGDTTQNRKRAHLQAQFKALMADEDEPTEPVRAHSHQRRWPFFKRQEEGREEGVLDGEGGGPWPRRSSQQLRRGGGGEGQRFRGGQLEQMSTCSPLNKCCGYICSLIRNMYVASYAALLVCMYKVRVCTSTDAIQLSICWEA